MKTRIGFLTVCLLVAGMVTSALGKGVTVLNGQSLTELGEYQISPSSKAMQFANETLKTYELNYSNIQSPVLIGVKKHKKCVDFIVRTGNFEVQYVCKNHVFGVKRIGAEYQTIPASEVSKLMDNADFYSQRIISQSPKTEEELLGLIACYFPSLIKDDYLHQL